MHKTAESGGKLKYNDLNFYYWLGHASKIRGGAATDISYFKLV